MENNKINYYDNQKKAFSLFHWTNKRYKGISIAYTLILFITLPLIELMKMLSVTSGGSIESYITDVEPLATRIAGTFFALAVMLFSTIYAFAAFSYMHNKRCVDLFGSFPVSKRTIFFARLSSVMIEMLIPLWIMGIIAGIITFSADAFNDIILTVLYLSLGVIANVIFIAVVSLCCGTIVDSLISYLAVSGAYPICALLCIVIPDSILPGFEAANIKNYSIYTLLCPFVAPFTGIWGDEHTLHIVWWIVFSMVMLAFAYVLSKKRKAEAAQNHVVFSAVENAIKFLACFAVGFGMGMVFAAVVATDELCSYKTQYMWFFVGVFIGTIMTGFILHLIYHRGLSGIIKTFYLCIADIVTIGIFILVLANGAFGYDTRIPESDDIAQVCVEFDDTSSFTVNGVDIKQRYYSDKEHIDAALKCHEILVNKELEYKHKFYPIFDNSDLSTCEDEYSNIKIVYKLKNGSVISRYYDRGAYPTTINPIHKKFIEKECLEFKYLKEIPLKYVSDMTIYDLNGADKNLYSGTGSEENLKKVISALLKDADTMDKNELRKSQNDSSNALFDIAIEYENEKEETSYAYIYITDEFKNTISIKDELGFKSISRDYLKKEISTKNHFSTYENKDDIDLSTAKTVYFQAPESWDSKEQIYANLYSEDNDEFLYLETEKAGTNGAVAKCEKVKDNIWKFTYYDFETPVIDKYGFTKVMFYQYTEDNVNCTGCIKLNKKNNCLKLKKKKKNVVLVDYEYPLYKYSWEKLR